MGYDANLSFYQYVDDAPLRFTDPLGLRPIPPSVAATIIADFGSGDLPLPMRC